ncbi:MAG TPA: hypothetical protein VK988_13030 [Acidimicrobiales bacterium]|nr:hypothetical protein [Acidimicrobiales bacterium]
MTKPSPATLHHAFLARVLRKYELAGVVTTNYDLLAERTLRHRPMVRPPAPGFTYAGLPEEPLQGSSAFSVRHKWVNLTGTVTLCKLHGSLNWVASGDGLHAYADCRPAFRSGATSYIVAPKPEKTVPARLEPIWKAAATLLASAEEWIVVGYSAPKYDTAACDLLAAAAGASGHIRVVDRDRRVVERYTQLTARAVSWEGDLASFVGHG